MALRSIDTHTLCYHINSVVLQTITTYMFVRRFYHLVLTGGGGLMYHEHVMNYCNGYSRSKLIQTGKDLMELSSEVNCQFLWTTVYIQMVMMVTIMHMCVCYSLAVL